MKTTSLVKNLLKYENMAVALWLVSDVLWVMNFHTAAIILTAPILAVAIHIVWQLRKTKTLLFHHVTLLYWFTANAAWMTGEFFSVSMLWLYAVVLYVAGLSVAAANYAFHYSKMNKKPITKTKVMYRGIEMRIDKAAA